MVERRVSLLMKQKKDSSSGTISEDTCSLLGLSVNAVGGLNFLKGSFKETRLCRLLEAALNASSIG